MKISGLVAGVFSNDVIEVPLAASSLKEGAYYKLMLVNKELQEYQLLVWCDSVVPPNTEEGWVKFNPNT